jgi:hypothetical protein
MAMLGSREDDDKAAICDRVKGIVSKAAQSANEPFHVAVQSTNDIPHTGGRQDGRYFGKWRRLGLIGAQRTEPACNLLNSIPEERECQENGLPPQSASR